jgi:hypothetical protein
MIETELVSEMLVFDIKFALMDGWMNGLVYGWTNEYVGLLICGTDFYKKWME